MKETENQSLQFQIVPQCQFSIDYLILPKCFGFVSPKRLSVDHHKCSSAAKCSTAQLQLTAAPSTSCEQTYSTALFGTAAATSLAGSILPIL